MVRDGREGESDRENDNLQGRSHFPLYSTPHPEWVHLECLRTWQRSVVLTQPTHPKYQTNIDAVCNVCLEPFTGVAAPRSRHEQVLEYVGGAEIARLVAPGNLLISTRESSRENLEIMAAHPEVRSRLATWTKAVFLMLSVEPAGPAKGSGGLVAVSTSQPLAGGPPSDARLSAAEQRRWAALSSTPPRGTLVRHYDGGPLERGAPIAVAHVPAAAAEPPRLRSLTARGVRRAPPSWVWGDFDAVVAVVQEAAGAAPTTINVVWGYGGWGGTQVLAEIGRGGWGLLSAPELVALRPDPSLELSWELDFEWSRVVAAAKLPPPSEYSARGRRR